MPPADDTHTFSLLLCAIASFFWNAWGNSRQDWRWKGSDSRPRLPASKLEMPIHTQILFRTVTNKCTIISQIIIDYWLLLIICELIVHLLVIVKNNKNSWHIKTLYAHILAPYTHSITNIIHTHFGTLYTLNQVYYTYTFWHPIHTQSRILYTHFGTLYTHNHVYYTHILASYTHSITYTIYTHFGTLYTHNHVYYTHILAPYTHLIKYTIHTFWHPIHTQSGILYT